MTSIAIDLDLTDGSWADHVAPEKTPHNIGGTSATLDRIGLIPAGTMAGKSTVALLLTLPDGTHVFAETTLALFRGASRALLASPQAEAEDETAAPIGGRRYPGMRPSVIAAHAVREAVTAAREAGTLTSELLVQVANGLTGRLHGRAETAAGRAMLAAFNHAVDEFGLER